ncbi:hypothetical protein D3C80_1515280 [compost metagenome]
MGPGRLVGEQHARLVQGATAIAITQHPVVASIAEDRPEMPTGHFRAHMGQQHAARILRREQGVAERGRRHGLRFPAIARLAKTPRLLQVNQTPGAFLRAQALGRPAHLAQLIRTAGDQQHRVGALLLVQQQRAITGQLLGLLLVELGRTLALGSDDASQLPTRLVDRRQQGQQ